MVQDTSLAKQERDKAESDKAPQSVMENVLYGIKSSSSATSDANTTSPSCSGTSVCTGSPAFSSSYIVPIGSDVVSTPQEPETIEEAPPASTSTLRQRIQATKEARTQSNEAPRGLHAESTHVLAHTTPATPISPGRGSGEDVERAREQGAQAAAPPTQPPRLPLGHMGKEEMRKKFALWVCLFDGDYPQINVLTKLSLFHEEIRAKTHGGASMTQAPCDTQARHGLLRRLLRDSEYKHGDSYAYPPGSGWAEVKRVIFDSLSPALSKSAWRAICFMYEKISKAFSLGNVVSGFDVSVLATCRQLQAFRNGSFPFWCDVEHILGVNPHFQNLSEEDAKFVIDTISPFPDKMMSVGLLYEDEMNAILGSRP